MSEAVEQKQVYQAIGTVERKFGVPQNSPKAYKVTVKIGDGRKADYVSVTIFQQNAQAFNVISGIAEGTLVKIKGYAYTSQNKNLFLKGKSEPYWETQLVVNEIQPIDNIPYA